MGLVRFLSENKASFLSQMSMTHFSIYGCIQNYNLIASHARDRSE